jgi:hypothetical protein
MYFMNFLRLRLYGEQDNGKKQPKEIFRDQVEYVVQAIFYVKWKHRRNPIQRPNAKEIRKQSNGSR